MDTPASPAPFLGDDYIDYCYKWRICLLSGDRFKLCLEFIVFSPLLLSPFPLFMLLSTIEEDTECRPAEPYWLLLSKLFYEFIRFICILS